MIEVEKRDGSIVVFDSSKIFSAIFTFQLHPHRFLIVAGRVGRQTVVP